MEHLPISCNCDCAPRNETRLRTWLLLSLLLHSTLSVLFIVSDQNTTEEPTVIFMSPEQQEQPTMAMAPPTEQAPVLPVQAPPPTTIAETDAVEFELQLQQDSQFGVTKLMAEEYTPPAQGGSSDQTMAGQESAAQQANTQPTGQPKKEVVAQQSAAKPQTKVEQITPAAPITASTAPTLRQEEQSVALQPDAAMTVADQHPIGADSPPDTETNSSQQATKQDNEGFVGNGMASDSKGPINEKISLAKLTEGFLDFVKERGQNEPVTLHSNDIRYASYFQKVGWFLQNSFHLHNRPVTLDYAVRETIILQIEVEKSGALAACTIKQPTSAPAINNLIRKIVEAAAPFPPLPAHLKKDRLKISLPVSVDAHTGTHWYHFTFRG